MAKIAYYGMLLYGLLSGKSSAGVVVGSYFDYSSVSCHSPSFDLFHKGLVCGSAVAQSDDYETGFYRGVEISKKICNLTSSDVLIKKDPDIEESEKVWCESYDTLSEDQDYARGYRNGKKFCDDNVVISAQQDAIDLYCPYADQIGYSVDTLGQVSVSLGDKGSEGEEQS